MTSTPAGWYPNPDGDGRQRYWDGDAWTEHFHTPEAVQPKKAAAALSSAAAAIRPTQQELPEGTLWSAIGKPLTGVGAGRYRLDGHYLYFERGMLRTDAQQIPIASVSDVDVRQSMSQKARGVGSIVVKVQRATGLEVVTIEDVAEFREGQRMINDTSHAARLAIQRHANTHTYQGSLPVAPTSVPASSTPVAPSHDSDPISQLERLGKLRDAGVLTDDEFATQKAAILARM